MSFWKTKYAIEEGAQKLLEQVEKQESHGQLERIQWSI